MMRRCCGVYDLGCQRVAVAAPNSLPTFVCLCQGRYARMYYCQVCAVTALPQGCGTVAGGMRERTLRAHHVAVIVGTHQHCTGWMVPTCPSLRRSSCMWYASHTVWIALLFALLPVVSVPIGFILLFVCWLVFSFSSIKLIKQGETMSGRPETVHGGNGEGPASTVPQGNGRRMARPVLEGGTDQLAATRRRMEEARQPQWTLDSRVEDVLLEATARSTNMKLNDFLWQNLGGRGVVDTNRSVLLKELLKDPTRYIRDAGVLNEIHASSHYKRIRNDLRNKMFFDEDVRKLEENGVNTLIGWLEAAAEVKEIVHGITKQFLNAFLEDVRNSMRMSAPRYLEGCYESVYNARWHHVVEVPGGEGTGLEVREGESPQPWTYKAVGRTLEKDDGVQQSGAARLRLMVLTSDKAWPYSWNRKEDKSTRDCYVNCEVERVWRIVKDDLTEFFGTHGGTEFTPKRRLLIGDARDRESRWLPARTSSTSCCTMMRSKSKWLFTLLRIEHFFLTRPAGRCRRTWATPIMRLL
ncbi:putative retrotransposon hot spot (RHS) protein [Trypanosoma cruzi]|uniref:Putative retrotransposon hot spot (RHS) protein n=1 Tax=Trypanosoma cruzi TaxID=5693 RepID=A0A2V2VBT6_TRYCR|nr:putative retrotransposon hot spot (RHS) protein [Trypanosoma cruzi]